MKFLYIVDHFVPFPQSEYGGIWNVVAGTEEECFDLIVAEDQDNFLEYYGKLRKVMIKMEYMVIMMRITKIMRNTKSL